MTATACFYEYKWRIWAHKYMDYSVSYLDILFTIKIRTTCIKLWISALLETIEVRFAYFTDFLKKVWNDFSVYIIVTIKQSLNEFIILGIV